ncbi:hypothetical protein AUEXF2481DRAFT_40429 [Aureobasidium subglaciale EXF-2481]|uniref:Uncharacterized protein n=1 Tax=Aureobasidium subglaciale (strain EXF-2481) TaxID=1043005 RepID=A0A074YBL2_AURSE|nr:uncharacterized protein AUEXF2481DRAFT_40429 [Aureobasidium subglaciale EXF-2481]KEQ95163.1 hypothetical protein AUEXF2481DRAFT_40429 [Aureobasidium subglaciale EXF-2481]
MTDLILPAVGNRLHQSAASSHSELDHQTCRGSSIGRACGSYLLRYSKPQGRGFEPRLRLFLYTADRTFCFLHRGGGIAG